MAEAAITIHKISDDLYTTRFLCTAVFDDTQETTATKITLDELAHADPMAEAFTCSVESVKWQISGEGVVEVLLDDETPASVAQLTASGELFGGNLSEPGGDVLFSTTGMGSGDTYQVEMVVRKHDGFIHVPVAVEATITNEVDETPVVSFQTGDVITAAVEFSGPVFVKGQPVLELDINESTVEMLCSTPNNTETDTVEFEYVVLEGDTAEATEVAFGDIVLNGSAAITGGFADSAARLTGFDSDLSAIEINPEPEPEE